MAVKKTHQVQTTGSIGAVEAYHILLQRQINEDRILAERTRMFLLATSFLFLAFVTLLNPEWEGCIFTVLRILLPSVGIVLTILLFSFNQSAAISLDFWHKAQRKIEEEAEELDYMRREDITLHISGDDFVRGKKEWIRDEDGKLVLVTLKKPRGWWRKPLLDNTTIYRWFLPIVFLASWATSLVLVIVN